MRKIMIADIIERANSTEYKLGDLVSLLVPAPYAVTLANVRLSLADGVAFIDDSVGTLQKFIDHLVTVADSAGNEITGYIKTPGTGETYGPELVTNGGFDTDITGWTAYNSAIASISGGDSGNCLEITRTAGGSQAAYQQIIENHYCYLMEGKIKSGTSGNEQGRLSLNTEGSYISQTSTSSWETISGYRTSNSLDTRFYCTKISSTSGTMLFDSVSLKKVLSPSATGVTIVSEQGGTTQNWASIASGFNGHDLSGYTVTIHRGGHVFKCTTAGTSDASQPTFDAGEGATTTDGTVIWTECNAAGIYYLGPLTFQTQPKYGDNVHVKQYAQPIDYSVGDDVYSYDKSGGVARNRREITFQRMKSDDLALLLDFLDLIRGAKHNFLFTDENAIEHTAKILNPDDIRNTPTDYGYESDITIELYLIS